MCDQLELLRRVGIGIVQTGVEIDATVIVSVKEVIIFIRAAAVDGRRRATSVAGQNRGRTDDSGPRHQAG